MENNLQPRVGGMLALWVLCMAMFMLILDVAIVNVALPSIQRDLGFSSGNLQLVITTYALAFGGLLLLGGRVADVLGRKRMFTVGLFAFTLASFACGIALSDTMLLVARGVQGVGAALVAPAAMSLLVTIFTEGEPRNRALGVWSAVAAGGGAAGLVIGGLLTDFAGWRWVFLVNVPVGLAVLVASRTALPRDTSTERGHIDFAGAFAVTLGLVALGYGLERGGQSGFGDIAVLALLVASFALLASFTLIERRATEPLVPFTIFRLGNVVGANLASFLMSGVVIGVNYFLTLYFQRVLGFSPLLTGLAFLPMTVTIAVASSLSSRLVGRLGARSLLLAGMVALVIGAALLVRLSPETNYVSAVLPALLIVALGLGPGFAVGAIAATNGVPSSQQGVASGLLSTTQQVGGAVGLAVLVAVSSAVSGAAGMETPQALADGFRAAFVAMSVLALVAGLAVWGFVRERSSSRMLEQTD
jgi:EmrB/QacA subfamily drug resistance transporter